MDGLACWVGGDPEEGMVMKPAGGGQRKVDCVKDNESRTVLERGNREQLLTTGKANWNRSVKLKQICIKVHPQWWKIAPAALRNMSSLKRKLKHTHIFTVSQQQQHKEQRIQSMSSVIPLEIVFCQLNPLIIPPKYHCNWHHKNAETGGSRLCAMRGKIWYVTCTTCKCLNCTL